MRSDTVRLPPLNALRVFHAVMRHGSFRSAADELLVSPQAVGQQIKLLEDTLAVPLFDRRDGRSNPLKRPFSSPITCRVASTSSARG